MKYPKYGSGFKSKSALDFQNRRQPLNFISPYDGQVPAKPRLDLTKPFDSGWKEPKRPKGFALSLKGSTAAQRAALRTLARQLASRSPVGTALDVWNLIESLQVPITGTDIDVARGGWQKLLDCGVAPDLGPVDQINTCGVWAKIYSGAPYYQSGGALFCGFYKEVSPTMIQTATTWTYPNTTFPGVMPYHGPVLAQADGGLSAALAMQIPEALSFATTGWKNPPSLGSRVVSGFSQGYKAGYGLPQPKTLSQVVTVTPGGLRVTYRDPIGKPGPNVKEKKFVINMLRTTWYGHLTNFVGEAGDVIDALHKALPKDCKAKPPRGPGGRLLKNSRGYIVGPTATAKLAAIYECFEEMDGEKAVLNLVLNQIEDAAYGRLGRLAGKGARKAGFGVGFQTGPAL